METQKKFIAWKAKPNGDPILGTDRLMLGVSQRAVIKHLAYEEGVSHKIGDLVVRCKDGTMWFVPKVY
jgi:hypothetical protein